MSSARFAAICSILTALTLANSAVAANPTERKTSIAVMDLRAGERVSTDIVDALTATITQTLEELGPFEAISRKEIENMVEHEAMKQMLGCDEVSCMMEIGGALGVDLLVAGSVQSIDGTYVMHLQLTNVGEAKVESRVTREYSGGPKGLFEDARVATKLLMRNLLKLSSGRLLASVSEEGASIRIDGTIVGVSPHPSFEVAGGMHTLTVEKEGFVLFSRDVEIEAKQELAVEVNLIPSEDFKKQYAAAAGRTRLLAWSAIAVGAAGVVGSGVMLGMAYSRSGDLADDTRAYNEQALRSEDDLRALDRREREIGTLDAAGIVAGSVGLGLIATGILLHVTGDDPDRYEATATVSTTSVSVLPNGLSLTIGF